MARVRDALRERDASGVPRRDQRWGCVFCRMSAACRVLLAYSHKRLGVLATWRTLRQPTPRAV
eukprot:2595480-Prymnesium_polylepis.1